MFAVGHVDAHIVTVARQFLLQVAAHPVQHLEFELIGIGHVTQLAGVIKGVNVDLHGVSDKPVTLNVTRDKLSAALPIMADVALRPTFPTAEVERLRQELDDIAE